MAKEKGTDYRSLDNEGLAAKISEEQLRMKKNQVQPCG